jgi:hypothetical protein
MSWEGLRGTSVSYAPSPLETQRFGIPVARLTIQADVTDLEDVSAQITELMSASEADVVIARWPAHLTGCAAMIGGLVSGTIAADNLLYWETTPVDLLGRIDAVPGLETWAGGVGADELEDVFADSFADYRSHYSANPAFPPSKVLDGYLEWARTTVTTTPETVVTLARGGRPIGFATTILGGADGGTLEVELAGLVTSEQGGGRYYQLLRGVAQLAEARGMARIVISTQAGNIRVQRAWARAGFVPFAAFTTVHALRQTA